MALLNFGEDGSGDIMVADSLSRRGVIHRCAGRLCRQLWPWCEKFAPTPVQQQTGSDDCGLFAIALAEVAARGGSMSSVKFDQAKMRQHFAECLQNGELTAFPLVHEEITIKVHKT